MVWEGCPVMVSVVAKATYDLSGEPPNERLRHWKKGVSIEHLQNLYQTSLGYLQSSSFVIPCERESLKSNIN